MRRTRLMPVLVAMLVALSGAVVVPFTSPPASAQEAATTLDVALLGDSYSSGNGAGDYYGDSSAYRSRNSWAHHYVNWLNGQGVHTTLTNLSHSGATTGSVLAEQVAAVPEGTDLVMLTIGGNDVGFAAIVQKCFALGLRSASECQEAVDGASNGMAQVEESTRAILSALDAKLADGAQVILVGYPYLATDVSYTLRNWGKSYDAGSGVRGLTDQATAMQSSLVQEWNAAAPGLQATFVDGTATAFSGHEPDPSVWARNDYRWINEFFETEGRRAGDGTTTSTWSLDPAVFYHPNMIGHEQIGDLIAKQVGIPSAAKPAGARRAPIAPALAAADATPETPFAWIQGPYVARAGEKLTIDASASYATAGQITSYEWDFDGDGVYDETTSTPTVDHVFASEAEGSLALRVTQSNGGSAVATTDLLVSDDGDSTPAATDNCPTVGNWGQTDYDGDGLGDECDPAPGYPTADKDGVTVETAGGSDGN